jgi:hypothetical protein
LWVYTPAGILSTLNLHIGQKFFAAFRPFPRRSAASSSLPALFARAYKAPLSVTIPVCEAALREVLRAASRPGSGLVIPGSREDARSGMTTCAWQRLPIDMQVMAAAQRYP